MRELKRKLAVLQRQERMLQRAMVSVTDAGISTVALLKMIEEDARAAALPPPVLLPKLRKADRKRLKEISEEIADLYEEIRRRYPDIAFADLLQSLNS